MTILRHNRAVHDVLRQNPTVYRLREVDGAPQQAVNLFQTGVSRMGEHHAQRREITVRLPAEHSDEPEREEAVLNHVSSSRDGIAGVYQRYNFADEKWMALDVWGEFVARLVDPGKVITLAAE